MELLDRYLNAVKRFLPRNQQDDIISELSDNLQSQMDDEAEKLGRPLTEADQEAILNRLGDPLEVAGRYLPNQGGLVFGRQLITPAAFPSYIRVLQFNLGISFSIFVIVQVVLAVTGTTITFEGTLNAILLQIFFQFALVTGIFMAVDRSSSLVKLDWKKTADLSHPAFWFIGPEQPAKKQQIVPRLESIAQIVAIAILVVWLRVIFESPQLLFGPVSDTFQLEPIWGQVAIPTLAILAVSVAQSVINLFRPGWTRLPLITRLISDVATIALVSYLLSGAHWIGLVHPEAGDSHALDTINLYVWYGLWATLAGIVIALIVDIVKLIRGWGKQQQGSQSVQSKA